MPIYEYRCEKGHDFEAFQSMSDDPIAECLECGAPAQRVLSAPAVHFKGSGFYTTDYARKGKKASDSSSGSSSSESSSESSSSEGLSGDSASKSSGSKDVGTKGSDSSKKSSASSSSD